MPSNFNSIDPPLSRFSASIPEEVRMVLASVRAVLRLMFWIVTRPFQNAWTVLQIVMAAYTRRMPVDRELTATWWQLALFGIAFPFLALLVLEIHNSLDPPSQGFFPGLGRAITYMVYTFVFFFVIELTSIALGMFVSRSRPRLLWGLVPHMVVVFSLCGIVNAIWTSGLLMNAGIVPAALQPWDLYCMDAVAVAGAIAFAVWWTRRVLARAEADRLIQSFAAESQSEQGQSQ